MAKIPVPAPTMGDRDWFLHDRFGMFMHWGLYALPARGVWMKCFEKTPEEQYDCYFEHFDPDLYDPREWARATRDAGIKYLVVTAKHHEGFCLWDSKHTNYKVTNTPCGKDVLRPMIEAFREEGLKIGLYYSITDWHHPDYPIDMFHPLRDHPEVEELQKKRDLRKYVDYLHAQVRELMTDFGKIDILWMDFSYKARDYRDMMGETAKDWRSYELLDMVRELQPHILIDNRLTIPEGMIDIHTPEQYVPHEWVKVDGKPIVWEACHTFSGLWGYARDEYTWKSPEQLIQLLVNSVSCGGNLIMNIGPTARGTFDDRALKALKVYSDWTRLHSRSIYGCTQSEYEAPSDCRFTQNGKRLYVHIFNWPFRHLDLPGLDGKVEYAQLLHDGSEVTPPEREPDDYATTRHVKSGTLTLELPVRKPDVVVPVIELFLK